MKELKYSVKDIAPSPAAFGALYLTAGASFVIVGVRSFFYGIGFRSNGGRS